MNAADELIRLYAKQLKVPSFAEYQEVLRQAAPSDGFADLLLELMKAETASRQENQNRRRLKAAGFPYRRPWKNLIVPSSMTRSLRCSCKNWQAASLFITDKIL